MAVTVSTDWNEIFKETLYSLGTAFGPVIYFRSVCRVCLFEDNAVFGMHVS